MKNWLRQLGTLTLVNFYGYIREPAIIFWALVFPAGIAVVLGIAFQGGPAEVPIAIVYQQREIPQSPASGAVEAGQWKNAIERFSATGASGSGALHVEILDLDSARKQLKRGRIQLYVLISTDLPGYWKRQKEWSGTDVETSPSIQSYFDPNNPEARLALLSLERTFYRLNQSARLDVDLPSEKDGPERSPAGPEDSPVMESVALDTIGGRYIDFLIPGLLALGIMNSCMWGVGYGLIDLRVKKLLRRMAASPMYKSAFLSSHFFARMAFTLSEAIILFTFSHFLFGVRIEGSLPALLVIFLAGNVAWSGIAILCSSRGRSMHAANGIVNAVTLPLTMLSGIFFSYENFPDWSHSIIQWLPLTLLADSVRSIFIEGAGWTSVAAPSLVLLLTGLLAAALGLRIYRWH